MATGYIEINGTTHQIHGDFADNDPNFARVREDTRLLVAGGGPGMFTFNVDHDGQRVDLYVAADNVVTAAAWLTPSGAVYVH